jgi:hypothetical protein
MVILRCQQAAEPAASPMQLLSKTIRSTIGGRVPHAQQQQDGAAPKLERAGRGGGRQTASARRQPAKSIQTRSRGRAFLEKAAARKGGRFYWNITGFPFPLGPLLRRRTIRYEVRIIIIALACSCISTWIPCVHAQAVQQTSAAGEVLRCAAGPRAHLAL